MVTYYDVCAAARSVLREAGIEAYTQEARMLTAFAAEKTVSELLRDYNLYTNTMDRTMELVRRRASGEPAAYIIGAWEFYGLPFIVTPGVLIPRIDTEPLVEAALGLIHEGDRVLDLCCGTGCIGITAAKKIPGAHIVCADVSDTALKIARRNAALNEAHVVCVSADALAAPPATLGKFDFILCNPPYIATSELAGLDPSVRDYEPHLALDGGEDGLKFYRSVCTLWRAALTEDGRLIFECGEGQAAQVRAAAEAASFRYDGSVFDTGNIERVLLFTLNEEA